MTSVVEFSEVSKKYGKELVIDKVSFQVQPATITTLIGPNGAGKTTIARLMLAIESPSSGRVMLHGNKCAYIPQKIGFNSCLPMDVRSLIKYLSKDKVSKAENVMAFARLKDLSDKPINELSGGELQKVFLAASMLGDPELIVLDEPTQGLDISAQQEFYTLLEEIRLDRKVAIFMISHDLYAVMKNSDQVLCLNHHICCSGKPETKKRVGSTLSQIGLYTHHHDHNH